MEIIHVSAECYPVAKVGGLADVVGSLPKYQTSLGHLVKVMMPMHHTSFLLNHKWQTVYENSIPFQNVSVPFKIVKEQNNTLGFELHCIQVEGFFDRPNVYGYNDDADRFLVFQLAFVKWLSSWASNPDIIHVHDYHAGLIPFLMKNCYEYTHLSKIKTVLTIHNAQYQGWMPMSKADDFPSWEKWNTGLLEWDHQLNPLASAVKCADKVTTVSPSYMQELFSKANDIENLIASEKQKCSGIINGIDYSVWNPSSDPLLNVHFDSNNLDEGKLLNKRILCETFKFDEQLPLIIFIGRLVHEKSADLLPEALKRALEKYHGQFNFLMLGNGDPAIENELSAMHEQWLGYYHSKMEYNETLSHQMYAGADFLLMPSRVEPCGLNQMYALRYATIPIVRRTGGLKDTVIDFGEKNGYGICFDEATIEDIVYSIGRAIDLYHDDSKVNLIRKKMMTINNSWERSAKDYLELYDSIS